LRDAVDVKQGGQRHAHFHRNRQIGDNGKCERGQPYEHVRRIQAQNSSDFLPFAHVIGHNEEDRRQRCQRNEPRQWRE
jgi:hypothetical protein